MSKNKTKRKMSKESTGHLLQIIENKIGKKTTGEHREGIETITETASK